MTNPLLEPWDTPHGLPPFDRIEPDHFPDAFDAALAEHSEEIARIATAGEPPTFENTIVAMERAGRLLRRVSKTFYMLANAHTDPDIQAVEARISPKLAAHSTAIYTHPELYARVRSIRDGDEYPDGPERKLIDDLDSRFVRAGAGLDETGRRQVQQLDERLAGLTTQFSQHVLNDTNDYAMVLETAEELEGLPEGILQDAAARAEQHGQPGKYLFTISRSSITPFLQFSARRDLREEIYRAYTRCANQDNDRNNRRIIEEVVELRRQRARLLGFESHAAYMLDDRMAKTPANVRELLDRIREPARAKLAEEAADLQDRLQADGGNFELEPWDWWYYTEKLREERFSLEEDDVKPYFELEHVRDGAFEVARRLFGVTFRAVRGLPSYHPSVHTYEVHDEHGLVGLFLTDYHMRPSKRAGAWMSEFRDQSNLDEAVYPIVINCCNFPEADPCLLGMDEVRTLFHEFGHALHGLLSRVTYPTQSGTNVKQDFVELPSQIMERWALEPEVMRSYARHHESGEPIPEGTIAQLRVAETFNQGFATGEYLAACYLDLAWHEAAATPKDAEAFEAEVMAEIGFVDALDPRYKSTYFQHVFGGAAYSAGYYSYIWAEVLDADGFETFKEKGIFDRDTARAFRTHVLERGGSEDPMVLYRRFRGREPKVGPLLRNRGLD